ncbi:MAG TPA: MATE family efflux transporter, partial [Rhodothermales bacterium]|nr:MATE family efflux transporter [Rhodothermales bacterium]
ILIFGLGPIPALGIAGAAIATSVGRGIGVAYQVYLLLRGNGRLRLMRQHLRVQVDVMQRMVRIALPGMIQYLIGTASWLALFRILADFGSDALAGYTIAIRILVFALMPSWGMGNAAATLVGQNLGAGQPDEAERSVWIASFANAAFLGLIAFLMWLQAEELIMIFTDNAAVISYGADCLRIVSYTYVFFAFGMVTSQAFNGAGDTTTPTWINFFCYWLVQIPLAYVLAHPLGMGASGVFAAVAIVQAVLALVSVVVFRMGRWKLKTV